MRNSFTFILAILLGAGSYFAYYKLSAPKKAAPPEVSLGGAGGGSREPAAPAAAPPGPILSEDALPAGGSPAPSPGEGASGVAESIKPPAAPAPGDGPGSAPAPGGAREPGKEAPVIARIPEVGSQPAIETASGQSGGAGGEVESALARSRAAFAAGDRVVGVKLLREAFEKGKEDTGLDLVAAARQLFEVEERGAGDRPAASPGAPGSAQRLDVCRYLVSRDADPAWRYRAAYLLGSEEVKDTSAASMTAAWADLSTAYLTAAGAPERQRVMTVLAPFIQKNVLSQRYSPLVESYTVKGGDSLNKIAKLKLTTEEALVRLNGLKGPVIQPGQRLRVLAGKPKIHVRKGEFRLWLTIGDRVLLEYPVGLGREGSTPVSTFVIAVRQKEPVWYRRGEPPIPYGDPKNILGSRWLGFKDTEDLIGFGIHGTSDPSSIGKEASSGCIRLRNEELEVLWDFIPIGTEVEILE